MSFKPGDICISKKGTKPFRVTAGTCGYTYGCYLHNNRSCEFYFENVMLYDESTMSTNTNMNTLYSFTVEGLLRYGHQLAVNSAGLCVMEEKPGGTIHTLEKSQLTEVVPYTVGMREMNSSNTINVLATEGVYTKNDMIIHSGKIYIVTNLNTKAKSAVEITNARRILTEEIK
jgi:uncharacterized Zn finger protein